MSAADPLLLAGLFAVGVVSGALNVVAGGGSFLTLPALLYLGLPAADANGTNRVGVLAQNAAGLWGFHRAGAMEWRWGAAAAVAAMAGALIGAWLALQLSDFGFRRVLAVAMLGMTLWTVLAKRPVASTAAVRSPWHPGLIAAFFAIGVYGGLIQAGVGFAILAATSLSGLDLVRGNGVKMLVVQLMMLVSLTVFAAGGAVQWLPGLVLAGGNAAGAFVGVRLAVMRGHVWIQRVVTAAVVLVAGLLLLTP